ncbi:amidohydrolase [Phycicoccus sp. Soil802]|uniref:amidohydrolase n=1 Tax=Phycicoccus sp. Soil802 TaxID=1736414 RepID=UPI0007039C51|nr:amidohydrolase [Phycicoccus sp. Soil802]KRF27264.1 N-acyl-L-amino acid amidohydrolase [Phycicoccus sp. Soil802]
MTDNLLMALCASIDALAPELLDLQHDVHAHPELSRGEARTTAAVARRLAAAGITHRTLPVSGLVADLGAEQPAYRVALRADLDALPVGERTGLPWASTTEGICHACGHDVHVAAMLGAGLALKQHEEALRERGIGVRLLFQPAEEVIPGGAVDLLAEGALDGVDAIFAVHCDPSLDVGSVGLRDGAITAAADRVSVHLSGRGGHTSRPHLTEDLTFALAKVVTELPAVLSRRLDPRTAFALVWGEVHAGQAANVIPSSGAIAGTLRMLDAKAWTTIGPLLAEAVEHVVAPYAVTAVLEHVQGVPPVVNDPEAIEVLRAAAEGAGLVAVGTPQSLGGEDFAWYLRQVPGAMARLGTRTPGGPTYDLHQGDLVVDDGSVVQGARLLAGAVVAGVVKTRAGAPAAV